MSSILKDSFATVVSKLKDDSRSDSFIRRLMMKSLGEKDMSIQEVIHSISSLKLCSISFQVITDSLDGTRQLQFDQKEVKTKKSDLDTYAKRLELNASLIDVNLIELCLMIVMNNNRFEKHGHVVVVKTFPIFSSNPANKNFPLHCKHQMI